MAESPHHIHGEEGRIILEGTITDAVSGALWDAYSSSGKSAEVVLECTGIEHIDIFGLNELIKMWLRARSQKRSVRATGVSRELMGIFRATHTDEAFGPQPGAGPSAYSKEKAAAWAEPIERIHLSEVPEGAVNLNVDGLAVVGPIQGFGQLWEKIFRVRLVGVKATPAEVMKVFKENFVGLQPPQNRFFPTSRGISPGEVVLINAHTPAGFISTGVWVVYADDTVFSLMTPQGHPESGWVSFSAFEDFGCTVAQVVAFARTNDPLFELGFRIMGSREHERIWTSVLESLASRFGVPGWVRMHKSCVGPDLQWENARNIWYNAQLRTTISSLRKAAS